MSWVGIGGAAASAVVSNVMSDGVGGAPTATQVAARDPYAISGGLFDTSFEDGQATIATDPRLLQGIQGQFLGQAGQYAGAGVDPALQALSQQSMGLGGQFLGQAGLPQASGMAAIQQALQPTTAGQTAQDLAMQQGVLGAAGEQFVQGAGAFDPFGAAQTQYGRMEAMMAPAREQERMAQESRLFSQGRLGSTGGAQQQQALEEAFGQQQQQNLVSSLGQAQAIQAQGVGLGTQLTSQDLAQRQMMGGLGISQAGQGMQQAGMFGDVGFGLENLGIQRQQAMAGLGTQLGAFGASSPLQQQQLQQQLATGALTGAMAPEELAMEQLRVGGALGGTTQTTTGATPMSSRERMAMGLEGAAVDMFGNAIQGADWTTAFGQEGAYMNPNSGAYNPAAFTSGGGEGGTWDKPDWS